VNPSFRKQGLALMLAQYFRYMARDLGYRASFFNLVFVSNVASVGLWEKAEGFAVCGRVPRAGRLNGHDELVDALQIHSDFEQLPPTSTILPC
jgi:ribosomal protein S18 acetylase RimI-like enzyme